jgi:hypothetical protein
VWIEGIGSLVGGVRGGYVQLMVGAIPTLRTCKEDGQTLYEAYHPLLKQGKTWNYRESYHNLLDNEQWTKDVSYVINGTTEIGGKTYYVMYRGTEEGFEPYCTLREEGRKVWIKPPYDSERLLYDFGMSAGESYILSYTPFFYQLTAIKPMRFHVNQLLNVLYYDIYEMLDADATNPANFINYFATAPIVEGVGCEKGWNITELFTEQPTNGIIQGEQFLSCYEDGKCIFTADDFNDLTNPNPADNIAYRPMIEDDKVWKLGDDSGNPVQRVEYYYFDGDTIIDGRACKQMMCQRYISPNHPDYDNFSKLPSLSYVGAWYEEDKKVYEYNTIDEQFKLMYDFSVDDNATLQIHGQSYVIGPKQTGGIKGFKGVYRDVMWGGGALYNTYNTTWLEGIGGIDGPIYSVYLGNEGHALFLISCTVGDEVIYLNDLYEDGATPEGARKRFDFTHTIKTQPQAPRRAMGTEASSSTEAEQSLYGEYNNLQLGINLDPLDDAYLVRITDETGTAVYEKTVNAASIVGLNIDISTYAAGRYTVTVENSRESFTGEFEVQTAGIEENVIIEKINNGSIYNLQGQRINSLQKGLNIVNGQKIILK